MRVPVFRIFTVSDFVSDFLKFLRSVHSCCELGMLIRWHRVNKQNRDTTITCFQWQFFIVIKLIHVYKGYYTHSGLLAKPLKVKAPKKLRYKIAEFDSIQIRCFIMTVYLLGFKFFSKQFQVTHFTMIKVYIILTWHWCFPHCAYRKWCCVKIYDKLHC